MGFAILLLGFPPGKELIKLESALIESNLEQQNWMLSVCEEIG